MSWSTYKFSKECEPELQEFLKAIAEQSSSANDLDVNNVWKKLFPVDEAIQKQIDSYKSKSSNEVIIIEDEETIENVDCKDKQLQDEEDFLLPDQSFTQLTLNDTKLNTTVTEDLIDGVKELLQTQSFLPEDVIKQFGSELSVHRLQEIFTLFASSLNLECTLNLWKSIMAANCMERNIVASCFSQYILIPKIMSVDDSSIKSFFKEIFNTYPDQLVIMLTKILFQTNTTTDLTTLRNNIGALSHEHKHFLLRAFLDEYPKLESCYLPSLINLVTSQTDAKSFNQLLELMSAVAKDFGNDKVFGKLLLEILQAVGSNIASNEQQLRYIASTHKSIFKTQIVKLLESSLQDLKFIT